MKDERRKSVLLLTMYACQSHIIILLARLSIYELRKKEGKLQYLGCLKVTTHREMHIKKRRTDLKEYN